MKIILAVLGKVFGLATNSKWDNGIFSYGIKSYLEDSYLQKELGDSAGIKELVVAKMLVFKKICQALANVHQGELTCVIEFAKAKPLIAAKIAELHLEYSVNATIAKACITDEVLRAKVLSTLDQNVSLS